MKECNFFVLPS